MVAALLGIPFYVLNFKKDFGRIMDYFVGEYNAGRTPNPCVRCNDWLKFGKLLAYADSIEADYVATGHYARVDRSTGRARLLRGLDEKKDQSYVLAGTRPERLQRMLLPIGAYEKPTIRQMAEDRNLPVFNKPDSQEICFVPDNDYARLVKKRSPESVQPGAILDREGNEVGEHPGHQHFTIGQRRGVGVALGYPIYVVHKDPQANTITIDQKQALYSGGLRASQANWLCDPPTGEPRRIEARIRHNAKPVPGRLWATGSETLEVWFDEPQSAVTPGQVVACYEGSELIAGAWIDEAVA
jgi:tRNA-specific 2-thiouridylase